MVRMASANITWVSYRPWVSSKILVTEYPLAENQLVSLQNNLNIKGQNGLRVGKFLVRLGWDELGNEK
jgi:hypothetical protein